MNEATGPGRVVAITGGIACGKSEVGRILEGRRVQTRDADDVAHDLMEPGDAVYDRVVEQFGRSVLREDGRIDRHALGERVFASDMERRALNQIVHPAVAADFQAWAGRVRTSGEYGAAIVPLLFEAGMENSWDGIICVAASEETMIQRLEGRGLSRAQACQRIASQMPVAEKMKRADYVIENNGTRDELRERTLAVWQTILEKERLNHG